MTYKIPDCHKCDNTGKYIRTWRKPIILTPCDGSHATSSFEMEEVFCNCKHAENIATAIPVRTRYEAHLPSHSEDNQIE